MTPHFSRGVPHFMHASSSIPRLPVEIVNVILAHTARSQLTEFCVVSKAWHSLAMPLLYEYVCISTPYHWGCFVRTVIAPSDACLLLRVRSLVLTPSPKLTPAPRGFSQRGAPRGYFRIKLIDRDRTGLEHLGSHYAELDNATKEAEWLAEVTPESASSVLERLPNLEYLDMSGCEQLGDLPFVPSLRAAQLSLVRGLTPNGLAHLTAARHLKYLDLSFCLQINDVIFEQAVKHWPALVHVRLNSLYHLTDRSILQLARSCPDLELVYLARCWQVTNQSMEALARQCPKLKYVSAAFLSRVDEGGIQSLVTGLKDLEWIDITGCAINPLLRSVITQSLNTMRQESHQWNPVEFRDSAITLI
ncbi:hypothetical protein BX666DRAFT_1879581 [Dichotomocladium elegans]|nr:hypothetical protein BX666DRAFT_1879581 [Dichotomocladium elegans]